MWATQVRLPVVNFVLFTVLEARSAGILHFRVLKDYSLWVSKLANTAGCISTSHIAGSNITLGVP